MAGEPLVEYLAWPGRLPPSGLRVWVDGRVELAHQSESWEPLVRLGPRQVALVRSAVLESGLLDLPELVERPPLQRDGSVAEWRASVDGRSARVRVEGWSDSNDAAKPLRDLVLRIDAVVAEAQDGRGD